MLFLDQYRAVRAHSEWLCAPLEAEDYVVQPVPDVSPPKWHLGHTTWFFETFLLRPHLPGYTVFDAAYDFVVGLRLPYLGLLGLKGFAVGFAWLALPATFLAVGMQPFPAAPLFAFLGVAQLSLVVMYLPFLQARVGLTGKLRSGFELVAVRDDFRYAPWAFVFAFTATLAFALPLYLFKIEVIPREAAWLPGLVFVAFLAPARLLTGYALGRAKRRRERAGRPRHFVFRWSARLLFPPVAGVYVLWLLLTPFTSWNGVASFYEQHAFLLPIPIIAF